MSPAKLHTRESIIDAIRDYERTYGTTPSAIDWNVAMARANGRDDLADRFYEDGCWPHTGTVVSYFGSWNAAIRAAGFEPRGRGQKRADANWAADKILDAIRHWADNHDGEPPVAYDWYHAGDDHPSSFQAAYRFGSWSAAIAAAGLTPRGVGFQRGNRYGLRASLAASKKATT